MFMISYSRKDIRLLALKHYSDNERNFSYQANKELAILMSCNVLSFIILRKSKHGIRKCHT